MTENKSNKDPESDRSENSESETPSLRPDEVFCTECGSAIKERAEVCPECGVRQKSIPTEEPDQQSQQGIKSLTDKRKYELEKKAGAEKTVTILLALFLTPAGYWVIDEKMLAILNLLTFNFLLFGPIVVPIHCHVMIENAKQELQEAGVEGY
jgi:hypothetical protein